MRSVRSVAALVAAGVLLAWLLAGCGASAREKTIHATLTATDAARTAFVGFDEQYQHVIVTEAKDLDSGKAALVAYRAKRAHTIDVFGATYRAIATAAILNDDKSFTGLLQAAALLSDDLHSLGVIK